MSMSFDVVDEVLNGSIEKLAQIIGPLSEETKVAYIPSVEEQHERPEKDFALVLFHPHSGIIHKYALYTPELTELNLAYLDDKQNNLPEEVIKVAATNLVTAAKKYNIGVPEGLTKWASANAYISNTVDVRDINSVQYAEKIAKAIEPDTFAWPAEQKYPLDSDENIKEAVAYFERYHKEFTDIGKKLEYAINTKLAASKADIPVEQTEIEKYSNLSSSHFNTDFAGHVEIRRSFVNDNQDDSITLYDDLISRAEELGPVKTAEVMYELDKQADITRAYGNGVEDPILSTLSTVGTDSGTVDGVLVKHSTLRTLDEGALTKLVGNDVISELKGEDGIAVLKSLPKPIRSSILDELAS